MVNFLVSKNFLLILLPIYGFFNFNVFNLFASTSFASELSKLENSKENFSEDTSLNKDLYIIGPGDILELEIYELKDEQKLKKLKVLSDGNIVIPYVGNIQVSGLSLEQAKNEIQKKLGQELINPLVGLQIIKERGVKVAIYGEINRPGIYSFDGGGNASQIDNPTIIDGIQQGGGITPYADLRSVYVKRKLPGNENEFKIAKLDLLSALIEGNLSQNILLFDGDSLHIAKVKDGNYEEEIITSTNAASDKISVSVVGGVVNPGQIVLKNGSTLNQAILFAGGPVNFKSNLSNIQVIRVNKNGSISSTKHKFNYKNLNQKSNNPILKEGDIVRVPENALSKTGDALTVIGKPVIILDTLVKSFDKLLGN